MEVAPRVAKSLKEMCSNVKLLSRELQSYTPSTLVPLRTASALTEEKKKTTFTKDQKGVCACLFVCISLQVYACVCVCVHMHMRERERMHMRESERMHTSIIYYIE